MLKKMKQIVSYLKKKGDYYDYNLLAVIILLICFGLIMLYSTSAYTAELKFKDDMHFFRKQAIVSGVCIIGMVVVSRLNYHILKTLCVPIYFIALIAMLLVQSPLGVDANGAMRWLKLGPVQFQPAEIAKLAVIVCIPTIIVAMGKKIGSKKGGLLIIVLGGVLAFVAKQFTDNLSTAIIIAGITVGLLFLAYPRSKAFYITGVICGILGTIGIYLLANNIDNAKSFRIQRVLVWLNPEKYASQGGYQILQALYAIGSGGFFGKGLGNSAQKLGAVPEAQNDMIFSIICEELGIFGGAIIMILFCYLLYRLFFIAQNAPDLYGSLMVSGIFIHIALQVVFNICVVINLIPTTGITLPFVSYGGTSILFLMTEMAIALSVSRQIKFAEE